MRHDTPKDVPAVREQPEALSRLHGMETLEALYQAWLALKVEHAAAKVRHAEERQRLEQQGSFLVGSVRAAGGLPPSRLEGEDALVPQAGLDDFLQDAEAKLLEARRALEESIARQEADGAQRFAEVRELISAQIQRYLQRVKPKLRLVLRPIGQHRAILHVERVGRDEAVLLLHVLTGRIPSRYDFLFDDSTEDVGLAPAPLYPDAGVAAEETRPGALLLSEKVRSAGPVLPVKGFLPLWVPRSGGGEDFFRLLERGPVMEAELLDGDGFRAVLQREEAERVAGYLLRLKLEGRVELEIQTG